MIHFINQQALVLLFLSHFVIFFGTLYVAVHNRNLKPWHVTPLWYFGLVNLLISIAIMIEWVFGPEYVLSYWRLQNVYALLENLVLTYLVISMFIGTLLRDLKEKRMRKE